MPKTKTYTTWKFEEVSDKIKDKIYEKYRYFNVEDSWWYEYDGKTGFTSKEVERMGVDLKDVPDELIKYKNIYFDIDRGWYIQFTNASFVDDEIARKFLCVPKEIWDRTSWSFENRDYGGSCHGTTKLVYDFDEYKYDEEYDGLSDEELKKLEEEAERILDNAVEIFSDKMEEALRNLRSDYEYQTSDEAIAETMIANEYDFDEYGNID